MKVYLSPSDQTDNKYAYGDFTEAEVCRKIAEKASEYLWKCGIENKVATTGYDISHRIAESNSYNPDIHMPIHTNAGGGDGALVLCYGGYKNHKYVVSIYNAVAESTPTSDDGIRENNNLSEIINTIAICVYVECEFHDNSNYAKWIVNNIDALGKAIAKGCCDAFGISFKYTTNSNEETTSDNLYHVQCGAFKNFNNAEALGNKLKKDGYPIYIFSENGLYKVQVGAYSDRKNAETMANNLKKSGYSTYIC